MILFPAIDLKDGKCVRLTQGDFNKSTVYNSSPIDQAKIFEDLGGEVEYFGKPYPNVYQQAADIKNKKILCIGDNLNTDIKGANIQNFDSMLISSGIHKKEIDKNIEKVQFKYNVKIDYYQSFLKW